MTIRISGICTKQNSIVKIGAHHTFEAKVHDEVEIIKEEWDSMHMERVKEATDFKRAAEVGVLLLDTGVANLYLTSPYLSRLVGQVNMNIPKRRAQFNNRDKAMKSFFDAVTSLIVQHVLALVPELNPHLESNSDSSSAGGVQALIIAGPGFTYSDFCKYLEEQKLNTGASVLLRKCPTEFFVPTRASSVLRPALDEVMANPDIGDKVLAGRAAQQQKAFSAFYKALLDTPQKVCYGTRHCFYAAGRGAVQKILITERLFKHAIPQERKNIVKLLDEVRLGGGEVLVCADQHISGEQLNGLGGVACFLRFEMEELDEMSDDEMDDHLEAEDDFMPEARNGFDFDAFA